MKTWLKAVAVAITVSAVALPSLINAEEMMMPKFDYSSVATIQQGGNELAPLRTVAESLGFKVEWNEANRSVALMKTMPMEDKSTMEDKSMVEDKTMKDQPMMDKMMDKSSMITIFIDSKTITVGDVNEMLMVAPTIVNDMTYVPKEFIDTYLLKEMKMIK
ncbi:copper amine oxidase N-terminal domain-containing protein [Bacillus sp. 3255]|uniref:copper amine oxidase N-terminal domain-containing protein n=1 Tax=Bacillus sp. 3255 TaxID=2817904 RepID=UPI0028625059|nr:copper amine oxidase N-terminal domain-containing protein [Bacillus sp. 3255]MDR6881728.1 hypothetical protein [Bacillus sp. 3255]